MDKTPLSSGTRFILLETPSKLADFHNDIVNTNRLLAER
jgi:hypothetical protein